MIKWEKKRKSRVRKEEENKGGENKGGKRATNSVDTGKKIVYLEKVVVAAVEIVFFWGEKE